MTTEERKIAKRDKQRQWRKDHPEASRASSRKYRETHLEQCNAKVRKWREEHLERSRANSRNWRREHKEQADAKRREWRREHPEQERGYRDKYYASHKEQINASKRTQKYGITPEDQDKLLVEQGGVCAVCGDIRGKYGLGIDHDHTTKEVRGWLCGKCNTGLGYFDDNPEWLRQAADFLEKKTSKITSLTPNT